MSQTTKSAGLNPTKNTLPDSKRDQVSAYLNERLATLIDLQMQAKQAHWNLRGPGFIGLHLLFDALYEDLGKWVDTVAERIAQLGGQVEGTVQIVVKRTTLDDYPIRAVACKEHILYMSDALAKTAGEFRQTIDWTADLGDAVTADMATNVTKELDIWLWKVEANAG